MAMTGSRQATPEATERAVLFRLARELGRTVAELEHTISEAEFGEWCAFYIGENAAHEHARIAAKNKGSG